LKGKEKEKKPHPGAFYLQQTREEVYELQHKTPTQPARKHKGPLPKASFLPRERERSKDDSSVTNLYN